MTVLVANGNAGDRSLGAPLAAALAEHGLGFCSSTTAATAATRAARPNVGWRWTAYRFLVEEAGVPPERLLYYGESLGAAVVTELAVEHPQAGMVLRSPFVDLAAVGRLHYPFLPVDALLQDRFPTAENVARLVVPVTVVYGTRDSVAPAEQSRTVAAAVRDHVRTVAVAVAVADHNDLALPNGPELVDAVVTAA